ncbi:pro-sigmaK processing inhibitor BofA family protein [Bacillus xiapuensis]|uniref:pro-sigmaK processing inhibitor BofA family protein n=1 Tax=Bacillus xiapuensis TaxID=2014075 RepID=UPI001E338EAE|nr:pro-sigmaK processing inhibitor BofA family protein [Bacillus xiapuensis]
MYILAGLVVFILCVGLLASLSSPIRPVKLVSMFLMKAVIGAFFLFLLNSFSGEYGLHVPINLFTSAVAGILGIAGVIALAAIQLWII